MRKLSILLASALTFWLAPCASPMGMLGGSAALVVLGVLFALAASDGISSFAIASGALAALAGGVLGTASPAVGGAALVALAYAERTSRVRGRAAKLAHVAAALVAGGLSGGLAASYASASLVVRGAAVAVASVLAALPMLLDADDAIAHALDVAAEDVSEPAKTWLHEGAEIRRLPRDPLLDRPEVLHSGKTWRALQKLADARIRLERPRTHTALTKEPATGTDPYRASTGESAQSLVDQGIADHVKTLARAYRE